MNDNNSTKHAKPTSYALPLLSVVIPSFNSSGTLKGLLTGLSSQTLAKDRYEIIVVDDGSEDQSARIAASFPNVILLEQKRQGPGIARNKGTAKARGKYVLYLDSDLFAAPDLLETHLRYHEAHPGIHATGGAVLPAHPLPFFSWRLTDHLCSWFNAHPGVSALNALEYLPSVNFCIKKQAVFERKKISWRDGLGHTGEDVIFCYFMRRRGLGLAFVPDALVYHDDRASFYGYMKHMYGWGLHAPYVRGILPGLKHGWLFPKRLGPLIFVLPIIVFGYTALIWVSWLRARPVAVTLSLPQVFLGRLAYAAGVWRGTREKSG